MQFLSMVRLSIGSLGGFPTSTFLRLRPRTLPSSRSIISFISSSLPPPASSHQLLQVPLFLRPTAYSASLSDLQKWHAWAKSLAASVGSAFLDSDNGPDSSLLSRELRWLLEDALHPHLPQGQEEERDGTVTDPSSLILLLPTIHSAQTEMKLKTSIEDLYSLWRQRIEDRRPFQYLVGCEHWRDLVLSVQDGVLIPRPETEALVDLVAAAAASGEEETLLCADLGTGSGAIAIGIARALLGCSRRPKVIASDLSPVAVQVASFNVQRYGLQEVVEVRQGSWFEPLQDVLGKLAVLVSNPPYIPSENISGLQAEVGRHEPRLALDGGVDGVDDLLHLCRGAASTLRPGGFFAFETNGERQCKFIVQYMEKELKGSFFDVQVVSDFAGIQRFVTGFRQQRSC